MPDLPSPYDEPLQWTWRLALLAASVGAAAAATCCGLELSGLVARDTLLRGATDAERWAGVAVGGLMQPFVLTALRHGRMRITTDAIHHLGLGILCTTGTIRLKDVRRWGTAIVTNRGRRQRHVLFELHDGSMSTIKIAMYRDVPRLLSTLEQRLGKPAATAAGLAGPRFDNPG